jgi:hypothetical protein
MLNPSRQLVASLAIVAVVLLALGLATNVGLFGWTAAVLIGLYLTVLAIARRVRRGSLASRKAA